jgi:hypothetical protein
VRTPGVGVAGTKIGEQGRRFIERMALARFAEPRPAFEVFLGHGLDDLFSLRASRARVDFSILTPMVV